ncbi:MAG: polysaccharide export protein [Magnetococcales bacterium]|nr:polysaccharide export protein [Magnetococcales bacterium]
MNFLTKQIFAKLTVTLFFGALIFTIAVPSGVYSADNDYRLGAGDTIAIKVFGENDLSLKTRLGATIAISYPLLGVIQVRDMTVGELEVFITAQLINGGYLIKPRVNVSIEEYRKFYVKGEVKIPGGYPYSPDLTLDKVISMVGGLTDRADQDQIFIQSENNRKKEQHPASSHVVIKPGDVVTVERRFF